MSESAGAGSAPPESGDGGSTWTWLLPALTFLAGAAVSAGLFAVGSSGDDAADRLDDRAGASASPSPEATLSPEQELVVQVPAVCLEAAELAESVTRALSDVAAAAGSLDARRLQESLDVVQQIRPEVEETSQACRDLALQGRVVVPDPTATPAAPPSPSPTA